MFRQISYRTAFFTFLVAFLWLVLGAVMLWSPIPRTLDISWEFFGTWIVLFFLIAAVGGALLTIAALNGLVARPRRPQPPVTSPESSTLWAPSGSSRPTPRRNG